MKQPPDSGAVVSAIGGNLLELFNNFVQEPGLKRQLLLSNQVGKERIVSQLHFYIY